jgi:regulator of replication initiation timing
MEIYEIVCWIKKLVEENDELKHENQRLRQVEEEYRDFLRITRRNKFEENIIRRPPFIRPYD